MRAHNKQVLECMRTAGKLLAQIFETITPIIKPGVTTLHIDAWIAQQQKARGLISCSKGYKGYKYVSCISVNDTIVHGVPSDYVVQEGDLVKVDVCVRYKLGCADMARVFYVGKQIPKEIQQFIWTAQEALNAGIAQAVPGNRISDISHAVQTVVEKQGYGIVQEFAGHGIGKNMHEEPDILNYGKPGKGPVITRGLGFAIEPMITMGNSEMYITQDGWTAKTKDGSLAMHVEDTVIVTEHGPEIITRL